MIFFDDASNELLSLLPSVRRARDYRLYCYNGERYIDLFMQGGLGLLGAKGKAVGTLIKAYTDRALLAGLPNIDTNRLSKEVLRRFPTYTALRIFDNVYEAQAKINEALQSDNKNLFLLRPFSEFLPEQNTQEDIALLHYPCPPALLPATVLFKDSLLAKKIPQVPVAAIKIAIQLKSLYEFDGLVKHYGEAHWQRGDKLTLCNFVRRGPYLYPLCTRDAYPDFFKAALAHKILLSPRYDFPSLIPPIFDEGELKFFKTKIVN